MKVFWTDTAVKHLSAIYTYIGQNSPQYAAKMIDRLTRRSQQIASFPLSGRVVTEFETKQIRELKALIALFITSNPTKSISLQFYTVHSKLCNLRKNKGAIGITSGASTPDKVVEEVLEKIFELKTVAQAV